MSNEADLPIELFWALICQNWLLNSSKNDFEIDYTESEIFDDQHQLPT